MAYGIIILLLRSTQTLHHFGCNGLRSGFTVNIIHFRRIFLQEWKYQRYMRDYMKVLKSLDDNVGRVLDYLEEHDLLDNTLVVYTSDQGFYMGEHGWFDTIPIHLYHYRNE